MTDKTVHIKDHAFWAYVTIFGTLWGGLELTLGTFLHILHVPKTGLIMTSLTVILLIAQRVIYPRRGATLGAAIIAACIKCLSPGGIILGPVVGILSEALMIELGLLLTSRSILTAMIAGILAIFSCQLQSLFKMWLYYGNDFIRAIIKVAEKFFDVHWTAALGFTIIGGLAAVLTGIGCIAGTTGYMSGRRAMRALENPNDSEISHVAATSPASMPDTPHVRFSKIPRTKRDPAETQRVINTRKYVFPCVILTIVLQCCTGLHPWLTDFTTVLGALVVMLTSLGLWARPVLKAIWWPKFWILTIIVSLLAGLILAWQIDGSFDVQKAALASGHMIARGAYVFSVVLWMTRSVRSDEFDTLCHAIHLPQLGLSLKQAYNILPDWIDRFNTLLASRPKGIRNAWRYLKTSAVEVLVLATIDAEKHASDKDAQTDA